MKLSMKMMSKIFLLLKMSCKDMSPLISENMDHSLPLFDRWKIRLHLTMCKFCRYYQEQLEVLRKLSRYLGQEDFQTHKTGFLSQARKEKIKRILKSQNSE